MKKTYSTFYFITFFFYSLVYGQDEKERKLDLSVNFTTDVFEASPSMDFYGYKTRKWRTLIKDYPFDTSGLPDLAWKTGSTLEAIFFLYQITGNQKIGSLHLSLTDDLMNTRDDNNGVLAWNQKAHKFWSSGNRYNYGYINLYDDKNKLKGILEFKDAKLDECYFTIDSISGANFSIAIENKRDGKKYRINKTNFESLEKDVNRIEWKSYVSDNNKNRVLNYIPWDTEKSLPKSISQQRLSSYYVPSIDVNAIHLNALINSYKIISQRKHKNKARRYYKFIEETIRANTELYLNETDTLCYFEYPKNSKTFMGGGVAYPYNKQFAYVAMLSKWNKIARSKRINEIIGKWASYFKSSTEKIEGGVTWRYWDDPTGTIKRYETENYGSHDIKYLMVIKENSDAFSEKEVLEITNALRNKLLVCEDEEVYHKTAFDFKWKDSGLVNTNYLSMGNLWPELFECYEEHVDISSLDWIDRVKMIYYFKKREK